MKKRVKKELIQYAAIGAVFLFVFATGLHTEVFGFVQRGFLATGFIRPSIEEPLQDAEFTTYIIDAGGNLVLTHEGMAEYNSDEFKKYLRELM